MIYINNFIIKTFELLGIFIIKTFVLLDVLLLPAILLAIIVFVVNVIFYKKSRTANLRLGIYTLAISTGLLALYVATSKSTPYIDMFFPYITGKNFLFRLIVELMAMLYVILAYIEPKYRPKKSLGLIAYTVFIVIIFIADILGVNPANSLWSNFERMEGFVTHIHLYLFTLILLSLGLNTIEWCRLLRINLIANAVVLIVAFADYLNILKQNVNGQVVGTRLQTMLGNSEYLSIYCAFNIAFVLILWIKEKRGMTFTSIVLSSASILFNLFILWQTGTRGTVLGLIGGIGAGLIWYGFRNRDSVKIRQITLACIAGIVLFIGLFIANKDSNFIQGNPTLKRIAGISLQDQTVRSRVLIWNMSWQGVKDRPILGWGQENFIYVFAKEYNPEMFDQEQWFDRSHDVFFDWLISAGFVGLFAYLALFVVILVHITKNKDKKFSHAEQSVLMGLLATYFIHNIFVFDSTISYIGFFTIFAYIFSEEVLVTNDKEKKGKNTPDNSPVLITILSLTVFSIIFYYVVYKPLILNTSIIRMFKTANSGTIDSLKGVADEMTKPALYGNSEANEQLLTLTTAVLKSNVSDTDKKYFYDKILKVYQDEIVNDKDNPRPAVLFGTFASGLGLYDLSEQSYTEALRRTPNKTLLWAEFARALVISGDIEMAEASALKSHTLSARSKDAAQMYSSILITQKKEDLALKVWEDTILANKNDKQIWANAIAFLQARGAKEQVTVLKQKFLKQYPEAEVELDTFLIQQAQNAIEKGKTQ